MLNKIVFIATVTMFLTIQPAQAATVSYSYDNLNRLISVNYGNGGKIEYTYDTEGNRIQKSATGLWYRDLDGDGYGNSEIRRYASTKPDGYVLDNTDCNDNYSHILGSRTWYPDLDGDGFGSSSDYTIACIQPENHIQNNIDCNDNDSSINPAAVEICEDGIDQDCNKNDIECGLLVFPPENLSVYGGEKTVELSWNLSKTSDVKGYNVYRGISVGNYDETPINGTDLIKNNRYVDNDSGLITETAYYYVVKAVNSDDIESKSSNEAQVTLGVLDIWIPDLKAKVGTTDLIVPINIRNADGLKMAAMDIWIDYDPEIIEPIGVERTILTEQYDFDESHNTPGRIKIVLATGMVSSELTGEGTLINIAFEVKGGIEGDMSTLDFVTSDTDIYSESNLFEPLPLNLVNGSLTISSGCMLGDLSGDGKITSTDSDLAMQIAVGKISPSECHQSAGDITGDGKIKANDSAMILYYINKSAWPPLLTTQQYVMAFPASIEISLPSGIIGLEGEFAVVPVKISDVTNLASLEITVNYDYSALDVQNVSLDGLVTAGFTVEYNADIPGILNIALSGKDFLTTGTNETVVNITFAIKKDGETALKLASYNMYDENGRNWERSALSVNVAPVEGDPVIGELQLVPTMTGWGILVLFIAIMAKISRSSNAYEKL